MGLSAEARNRGRIGKMKDSLPPQIDMLTVKKDINL